MPRTLAIIGILLFLPATVMVADVPPRPLPPPEAPDSEPVLPDFLKDLPELKGVSLKMAEKTFQALLAERKLRFERYATDKEPTHHTYHVSVPAKGKERDREANVIFGFKDGLCTGIQRMQPGPKENAAKDWSVPLPIMQAARHNVAIEWPEVDLDKVNLDITFHEKGIPINERIAWTFAFDAPPPIQARVTEVFGPNLEFNKALVYYHLSMDESGHQLGALLIQQ